MTKQKNADAQAIATGANAPAFKRAPEGYDEATYSLWRPKPDDELIGTYQGFTVVQGDTGPFNSHKIAKETSGEVFQVSGAILDAAFKDVPNGKKCIVRFVGMSENSKGQDMNVYKVFLAKS